MSDFKAKFLERIKSRGVNYRARGALLGERRGWDIKKKKKKEEKVGNNEHSIRQEQNKVAWKRSRINISTFRYNCRGPVERGRGMFGPSYVRQ